MYCHPCNSPARQRGAALVLALLVFAIAAALVVGMTRDFERLYQQGNRVLVNAQARAYLLGAEGLATLALVADVESDSKVGQVRDDLGELWAREATPYPLEGGGWLVGSIEDLQGRFNLNHLRVPPATAADGGPRLAPAQEQFVRLLLAVGEPELSEGQAIAITRAVADWLDEDRALRADGAEDDYYLGLVPAYRAGNRPLASASELLAVAGMTPALYAALEPWVTVWPASPAPLNVHTAPAMVLRSIGEEGNLAPLPALDAEALASERLEQPFVDLQGFLDHPALGGRGAAMGADTRALLGESSGYFLLSARVEVADTNTRLYSVLERKGRQVLVHARAAGSL